MPVLLPTLPDPTDLVIAGELMRSSVLEESVVGGKAEPYDQEALRSFMSLVSRADSYPPMNSFIEGSMVAIRRQRGGELQVRVNAGIATPCGSWIWIDYTPLLNRELWATTRFAVTGSTRDSTGAALGLCRVVALEVGRIAVDGAPVVAETTSDAGGAFTILVPMNVAYWLIGYKAGAPDVAGASLVTIVPDPV